MEVTGKYRLKFTIFFVISTLLWMGTCAVLLSNFFAQGFTQKEVEDTIGSQLLHIFMPILINIGIGIVAFIFFKEKLRNTIWMADIVLSVIVFGETAMYVVLGLWALDEFIIRPLYKMYRNKLTINKELDKRLK